MGRSPCCSKEGLNRGAWTAMEDKILTDYIKIHGEGKWRNVPKKADLKRCGKSCRLRWLNYLRPDIKRGNITHDEEELIVRLHKLLGNRWSLIAGRLPGRTDNEIKNYWNTNIGKKMQAQKASTSNHTSSNQSQEKPKHAIEQSVHLPPSANSNNNNNNNNNNNEPCLVRTKATRCNKVFISAEPEKTDQLDTKPVVIGPSVAQDLPAVDGEPVPSDGPESWSSSISEDKINPSDFMMDLEMDDRFLSEFLINTDLSQFCDLDDDHNGLIQGENYNSNTSHGSRQSPSNSDQTLFFSEDQLGPYSDFQSMVSFLDSEMDWS